MQRTHPMHFTEVKAALQILLESARLHSTHTGTSGRLCSLMFKLHTKSYLGSYVPAALPASLRAGTSAVLLSQRLSGGRPAGGQSISAPISSSSCFVHVAVAVSRQVKLNTDLDVYLLLYDGGQTN